MSTASTPSRYSASPKDSTMAFHVSVIRRIRELVKDPRRIARLVKDEREHLFADMLTRGEGLVPRDADLLLRLAAYSRQPQCFCDLVAWARQNGMRAAVEAVFDRILGNSRDPAYGDLARLVRDERSSAAVRGLSMDGEVH
jgi:hypothetical protein